MLQFGGARYAPAFLRYGGFLFFCFSVTRVWRGVELRELFCGERLIFQVGRRNRAKHINDRLIVGKNLRYAKGENRKKITSGRIFLLAFA